MQAVQIQKYGDCDTLEVVDIADPEPGPGQVLIEIHCAAVNPIDWKLRRGDLKLIHPLKLPAILGFDLCGTIISKGSAVEKFKVGDEVYARSNKKSGESYATCIALDADIVALKPEGMSHAQAAAIPLAALTALQALRDKGKLKAGQRVLINGASGGVGAYAIQIAKAMGAAEVVGVCSAGNADFIKSLGATQAIDYKNDDPLQTNSAYDLIFDAVANLNFARAKKALKQNSVLVTTVPNGSILFALALGNIFSSRKAKIIMVNSRGADLDYLRALVARGQLQSTIDSTFKLDEMKAAHQRSQTGHVRGKIVIQVQ